MKIVKVKHCIYSNLFMVYEYDAVIEYDNNGHIKNEYIINENVKRKRG